MSPSCPRCAHGGGPDTGDAEGLCSAHALQVLDEIVDELITTMKERPMLGEDPETTLD